MFMQRLRKDKRGLTLIELVCAIAILSIITLTISGAVVFSANSYRAGAIDTALQQEAQFTANTIESLIIDATDTVSYSGGVLTIKNVDYTYVITFNGTEKTLRYNQYETNTGAEVAANELLAEHVVKFWADTSRFAVSRNVVLEIGLENGSSTFVTNYNITSRNDASAGDPIEVVANIICEDEVVLEPLQTYMLGVSVVGPADTGFGCSLEAESGMSPDTKAEVVSGGINLTIGATETGGDDSMLRLLISTSAVKSDGTPFTKWVQIKIRRVNAVSFSSLTLDSGDSLKAGAVYSVNANVVGTNLSEVPGVAYDSGEHGYIDPNTIRWSFEISNGDNPADWIDASTTGTESNAVQFKLLRDITGSTSVTVVATALHPEGIERNYLWTNKASRKAAAVAKYATVKGEIELKKNGPWGDDILRRGDECYLTASHDYSELIKEEWMRNHPGQEWDPMQGYNGGYKGNTHYRFKSKDSDHTCPWYPNWDYMTDQGDDPARVKFNANDFDYMLYLEDYDLDLYFSFEYVDFNNQHKIYPADFDASNPNPDPRYVYTVPVNAMGIAFDRAKDETGNVIDLAPYSYVEATGIGSLDNPLELTQGYSTQIQYYNIGGASNDREAMSDILNGVKCYEWSGSSWVSKGNLQIINSFNGDKKSGILSFGTVNNMSKGKIYKLVLGDIQTATTPLEHYGDDNDEGKPGRGLIYFKLK